MVGQIARAIGGIRGGPGERIGPAVAGGRVGAESGREVVVVLPQGTIPRGDAFFDVELKGKTGTARLAAQTGAVVVPIGLWGTEKVWARSARVSPTCRWFVTHPPSRCRVGSTSLALSLTDAVADTETIMTAISALLPEESKVRHEPTAVKSWPAPSLPK